MKSQIYNQAKYYEIAFSFVDSEKQADLFEKFIKKYSKTGVKSVLDLACGTALQLREMAKRGYKSRMPRLSRNTAKQNYTIKLCNFVFLC